MSFPNIPENISPAINITRDNTIDLLLASIAFEELGLAHIINAEAEKIQSVLGTLEDQAVKDPSVSDLERIDNTVRRILRDVIFKEMLLLFKLENVIDLIVTSTTTTTTTTSTTTTTTTTTGRCGCSLLTTFEGELQPVFGLINNPSDPYDGEIAGLFASVCSDCQDPTNSALEYGIFDIGTGELVYLFIVNAATITVQCPNSGTIIVSGSGTASVPDDSSPATFTLTAVDNAPDTFQMSINAIDVAFNHDSGVVQLDFPEQGDIVVSDCTSSAPNKTCTPIDRAKLTDLSTKLMARFRKIRK